VRAGGQICLRSSPEVGTSIAVYLPAIEGASEGARVPSKRAVDLGLRVLVVDDEAAVRLTTRRLLERLGCSAVVAETADEGLAELARTDDFDVVLADASALALGGAALSSRVMSGGARPRFVVMSGRAPVEEVREWIADGRAGFLQKPFSVEALVLLLAAPTDARPEH